LSNTHTYPETRPTDLLSIVDKLRRILPVITRTTLGPKNKTLYSRNNTFEGNNQVQKADGGSSFDNHAYGVTHTKVHNYSATLLYDP